MATPLGPRPSLPTADSWGPSQLLRGLPGVTERTGLYSASCLSLLGWQVPSFSVFTLILQRGPSPFWTGLLPTSLLERKSGGVPSARLRVLSTSPHPIVPVSPRAAQTAEVRFCGAPHILGYLTHSVSSPTIPAESGIPPSEELVVPRTPSTAPASDSDSQEDKVRGSLCLLVQHAGRTLRVPSIPQFPVSVLPGSYMAWDSSLC